MLNVIGVPVLFTLLSVTVKTMLLPSVGVFAERTAVAVSLSMMVAVAVPPPAIVPSGLLGLVIVASAVSSFSRRASPPVAVLVEPLVALLATLTVPPEIAV